MAPQLWTERDVFVLGINTRRVFSSQLQGGMFLLPWAYMDPSVACCIWEPVSWSYKHKGRELVATVPLTVVKHSGELEYWTAEDTRRGVPMRVGVLRAHAEADGVPLRVFDQTFILDNAVEYRNRRVGYFLLASMVENRRGDGAKCEADVLQVLSSRATSLGQLTVLLDDHHSSETVTATVMDLWRRGLVDVPVAHERMGPHWMVRRVRHA